MGGGNRARDFDLTETVQPLAQVIVVHTKQ
jgi:hypothetical protein